MNLYQVLDVSQDVKFYLAKPNFETIHIFSDTNNRKLTVKYEDMHELSFSIPYKIDLNHQFVDNPAIDLVRERYLIKVVLGDLEEYFVINELIKSDNITTSDIQDLTIHCFYLPYELKYKLYKSYSATSYNCLQVTNDCLDSTSWKVGTIDPSFNVKYRQFDLSSGTRLDFLNSISTTFTAVKTYDTANRKVNFLTEDEVCQYKGLNIRSGQYIEGISDDINIDNMATRLFVYGNNDLTINSVSPNGQSYIEDFSYFLYPYEEDENGNVIQHSKFMSDALCKAIIAHSKLIEENQTTLSGYLNQISTIQEQITTTNNQIDTDKSNLQQANDDLSIALANGQDTSDINTQIASLNVDLKAQNKLLDSYNSQITIIQSKINDLKNTLILENYLSFINKSYLLDELKYYIFEKDFTDDNIIDATDLYNEGLSQLAKINCPPINISINIVDFIAVLEENYNWKRLNIGDLVNIIHPILGIKIQAKITQIDYDFEAQTIQLGISNGKRVLTKEQQAIMSIYNNNKVSKDYNNRKIDFMKTSYNFNSRNDRISDIPADPSFSNTNADITHVKNDDGSVTLTVNWNYPTDTTQNIYNIDGFNVYLYASDTKEMVTLGQIGNNESIINPSADVRKLTIPSVTANKYYYIGVQAYRRVDNDIESSGILLSNIVTSTICYPYLPEEMVNVQGRINGVMYTVDNKEPTLPQLNDIWTDTTTNTRKIYTSTGWEDANVGAASSVSGYYPDTTATPSTLVVRDDTGNISGVASLNSSGKVNYSVLPNSIIFGNYTGDGTQGRTITLPFTPRLIKVYTTNTFDVSLYITSRNGGYKQFVNNSLISLVGMTDYTPSPAFGKIIDNGFTISTDSNLYGNVQNFVYYFEAYL